MRSSVNYERCTEEQKQREGYQTNSIDDHCLKWEFLDDAYLQRKIKTFLCYSKILPQS
jgi:hypothetical protein